MSQILASKPLAKFYEEMELIDGYTYQVRTKYNDEFNTLAYEYAMEWLREDIFKRKYADAPLVKTGNEEEDARAEALYTPGNYVSRAEIEEEIPDFLIMKRIEQAKICLACTPVTVGAPAVREILSFIDQDKLDKVKGFFTKAKAPEVAPVTDAPASPKTSKTPGKVRKPNSKKSTK